MELKEACDHVMGLSLSELDERMREQTGFSLCLACEEEDCDGSCDCGDEDCGGEHLVTFTDNLELFVEHEPDIHVGEGSEYWACLTYLIHGKTEGPFTLEELADVAGADAEIRCRAFLVRLAVYNDEVI